MSNRLSFIPIVAALIVAAFIVLTAGCGPNRPSGDHGPSASAGGNAAAHPIGDTFRMTVVPYEAADKLADDYGPMTNYVARKLGKKDGHFVVVTDYAGVLPALQTGQVDVAYLSPFPYALATSQMKLQPVAMPWVKGNLLYHGIIFVRADSPIKTLQDLKGKTVAFGDPSSTSGYLLPRAMLEKQGIFKDLKRYYNAGDANVVAKAVESGTADAGAAYAMVFQVVYKDQPEKAKLMRVIGQTEEIPNGIYVARGDMPADEVEKLRATFMAMNTDPEGHAAMLKATNDRIVPPDDSLFNHVRDTAKQQGIDISLFDRKK